MGSISRSKIAEEEEWLRRERCKILHIGGDRRKDAQTHTDVGEEGMDAGEREPRRWVRRCCELWLESLRSREGLARLVAEVMCLSSAGEVVDPFMAGGLASAGRGERGVGVRRERE